MSALLTPAQLAALMGVSARTVARWDLEGCPCEWAGRRRRYDLEAVKAWNRERAACLFAKTPPAAGTSKPASNVAAYTAACRRVQVRVTPSSPNPS
jgi:phage terminase Nu1 subunit (DNA packaging protein)